MQTLPRTIHGRGDPFTSTHWSVVVAASDSQADTDASQQALAILCETYWPPLYTYARAHGYAAHDAQDVTQAFFTYLIEHRLYARTDREKGKFRSFLLASFKNFLSDAGDRARTLKRGGGHQFVPLDESRAAAAESLFQTHGETGTGAGNDDCLFERSWAETLVRTGLARVAAEYEAGGKADLFEKLRCFVTMGAAPLPSYAELATRLSISESTLRSHVTRLRTRYREALRDEIRRTVVREGEVDEELRELVRILSA